jgi:hypothetical protein
MRSLLPWLLVALLGVAIVVQGVRRPRCPEPGPAAAGPADVTRAAEHAADACPRALAETRVELSRCRGDDLGRSPDTEAVATSPSRAAGGARSAPAAPAPLASAKRRSPPAPSRAECEPPARFEGLGAASPADVLEPVLAELAEVPGGDFRWLMDLTCVLRDQRREFIAAVERGEEPRVAWERLREERQEAVAAVTAFLGPRRTELLRDVGGVALVAEAASCD